MGDPSPVAGKRRRPRVHKKPQAAAAFRNEINVTPLVDVCLVLLIIFMVVTPLMARGKDVKLPKADQLEEEQDKSQPIVVMDQEKKLYFDKDPVKDLPTLQAKVEEAWSKGAVGKVFVKADHRLNYGDVYPMIIAMHELGVPTIDLAVNEKKEK